MKFILPLTHGRKRQPTVQKGKLAFALMAFVSAFALISCGPSQDAETTSSAAEEPAPMAPAETENAQSRETGAETQSQETEPSAIESGGEASPATTSQTDSGRHDVTYSDTVWAPGHEEKLMLGLDGGEYEPYRATIVTEAQRELKSEGFYDGPVSGVIDEQTMEAIGEFQRENDLHISGVLSPLTREELLDEAVAPDEVS